jgi:hypothetical protein
VFDLARAVELASLARESDQDYDTAVRPIALECVKDRVQALKKNWYERHAQIFKGV